MGKPLFILDPIPGQEAANSDFLLERGAAAKVNRVEDAPFRIEQLIGSKPDLGPHERSYLEKTLKRWQAFAARLGDDERSQAIRAEGHGAYGLGGRDETYSLNSGTVMISPSRTMRSSSLLSILSSPARRRS